jgi:hypothetical protein
VQIGKVDLPQKNGRKYLGMHLDRKLIWTKHIKSKRKQLNQKAKQMHWLLRRRSKLSIESKLLLYKEVLKHIWTYGIQRFQSKTVRSIVDPPWYIKTTGSMKIYK